MRRCQQGKCMQRSHRGWAALCALHARHKQLSEVNHTAQAPWGSTSDLHHLRSPSPPAFCPSGCVNPARRSSTSLKCSSARRLLRALGCGGLPAGATAGTFNTPPFPSRVRSSACSAGALPSMQADDKTNGTAPEAATEQPAAKRQRRTSGNEWLRSWCGGSDGMHAMLLRCCSCAPLLVAWRMPWQSSCFAACSPPPATHAAHHCLQGVEKRTQA